MAHKKKKKAKVMLNPVRTVRYIGVNKGASLLTREGKVGGGVTFSLNIYYKAFL